jgi:hypothetical protein
MRSGLSTCKNFKMADSQHKDSQRDASTEDSQGIEHEDVAINLPDLDDTQIIDDIGGNVSAFLKARGFLV